MSISLAEMVAGQLKQTGRSQRWLAREMGVSPMTITNILRGGRPDVQTLEKLTGFLDRSLSVLLQVTGLTPAADPNEEELLKLLGDDWDTLELVNILRRLPKPERERVLQLVKVHLGEQ